MTAPEESYWFALKVFYNKSALIREDFHEAGYDTYQTDLVASLLFVHCPESFLLAYKRDHERLLLYYADLLTHRPGRIDEREMAIFRAATSIAGSDPGAMYLGSDTARLCTGDRVRVTDGLYKGAEGYVKRIRHARKVLVCIQGVAVVALSNIHPDYLEKIS